MFLPLGARGTPPTHKLRLVRTTRPPKGDLEVVGFAFNPCPTRDETASWLLDSYFGLVTKTYLLIGVVHTKTYVNNIELDNMNQTLV